MRTPNKANYLRTSLLARIERLRKLIELDAPPAIIGSEAALVFSGVLASYGTDAGLRLIEQIRDRDLAGKGMCQHGDCVNGIPPGSPDDPLPGYCSLCYAELLRQNPELKEP